MCGCVCACVSGVSERGAGCEYGFDERVRRVLCCAELLTAKKFVKMFVMTLGYLCFVHTCERGAALA